MNLSRITAILSILALYSCSGTEDKVVDHDVQETTHSWIFHFLRDSLSIPIRAIVNQDSLFFVNDTEKIPCQFQYFTGDSFRVDLPVFGTYLAGHFHGADSLSGQWINPFKTPVYSMPFFAIKRSETSLQSSVNETQQTYAVRFSPDTDDEYPAVGVFDQNGSRITGTFMTETGDYRFLEGEINGDSLWLSCFDGAHLFLFQAVKNDDLSLDGLFYSGKHWKEPWIAVPNPEAKLHDPDSITQIIGSAVDWEFRAYNNNRVEQLFNPTLLAGQVSIVQIFGSWCPNCMDESRFFKTLHNQYGEQGLQIIPVAFELGKDTSLWQSAVEKYSKHLELPYNFYFGGSASKGRAGEVFSMLSGISSFPTTLFIDKSGKIRRVHTGFYGPSTGEYYQEFIEETRALVETLLAEKP